MGKVVLELNDTQSLAFTALIGSDGRLRSDCPKELALFGGFRAGKSLVVMLIVHTICIAHPGTKFLFGRATYQELGDSCIPQYLRLFPPLGTGYRFLEAKREAQYANGSVVCFRAFDKDHKILSNEYDAAAFCQAEEIPEALFLMVMGRLSGKAIPKNILLCEGNPANTWPKKRYRIPFEKGTLSKDILFKELPTFENKANLPPDYIKRLLDEYPQSWIDRYVYGGWESSDEMVFTELVPEKHIIQPFRIEKHWKKIIGFDHGIKNPSAICFLAIDEERRIYVFDEFYGNAGVDEYKEVVNRHGRQSVIIDSSTKSADRDGGSLFDDLVRFKVPAIVANKDKLANIEIMNMLFKQNRLFIFTSCINSVRELTGYRWKRLRLGEDKNLPEEVIKKDDHTCDAIMYAIRYIKDFVTKDQKEMDYKKTLKYRTESFQNKLKLEDLA